MKVSALEAQNLELQEELGRRDEWLKQYHYLSNVNSEQQLSLRRDLRRAMRALEVLRRPGEQIPTHKGD